jgi:hypothetical protein
MVGVAVSHNGNGEAGNTMSPKKGQNNCPTRVELRSARTTIHKSPLTARSAYRYRVPLAHRQEKKREIFRSF